MKSIYFTAFCLEYNVYHPSLVEVDRKCCRWRYFQRWRCLTCPVCFPDIVRSLDWKLGVTGSNCNSIGWDHGQLLPGPGRFAKCDHSGNQEGVSTRNWFRGTTDPFRPGSTFRVARLPKRLGYVMSCWSRGPPSLPFSGYRRFFHRSKSASKLSSDL